MTMTPTVNTEKHTNGAFEQPTEGTAIRVILADSQAIYRVGMKKVFALEDDIRVVAQAETLANLHAALQRYPTDVVVLEGQMIAGTIDAIPDLVRRAPDAKLIVQVAEADEANIVELYRRGVRGVVPRSISPDLLIKCVRKIADGETWIDNQSISWVIEAYRSQASSLTNPRVQPKLSKKELAIISCITRGMRNKEIAYQIGTTEQVIKNYLRKVYDKLGVSDRLELALYCLHHQLLKSLPAGARGDAHAAGGTGDAAARQDVAGPSPAPKVPPKPSAQRDGSIRQCLLPASSAPLTPVQRNTFSACFLGWTLDAFDFFLLTFCLKAIAADLPRRPQAGGRSHLLDAGHAARRRISLRLDGGEVRPPPHADRSTSSPSPSSNWPPRLPPHCTASSSAARCLASPWAASGASARRWRWKRCLRKAAASSPACSRKATSAAICWLRCCLRRSFPTCMAPASSPTGASCS